MIAYLWILLPILIVVGLIYANRKQARVTATFGASEPEIDLTYRPLAPSASAAQTLPAKPRDPKLAAMSEEELVLEVLRECHDPEIPLNIVDLGLIYEVKVEKTAVKVRMSLTAPGCPSSQAITQDVRAKLQEAGFTNPEVQLVWEPQWTAERISLEGREKLGI